MVKTVFILFTLEAVLLVVNLIENKLKNVYISILG